MLSPDWQAENYAAAEVVAEILENEVNGERLPVDQVGEIIHSRWLERNSWGKEDPVLSKEFKDLPADEQAKDLKQYQIGLEVLQNSKKHESNDES